MAHPAPPAGIDLAAASPGELAHYGFPAAPPPGSPGYGTWRRVLHDARRYVAPTFALDPTISTHPLQSFRVGRATGTASGSANTSESESCNWSGNVAVNPTYPTGTNFQSIYGVWTEPSLFEGSSNVGVPRYSSRWVGLGGGTGASGDSDIAQIGTEADQTWNRSDTAETDTWYAWYENFPGPSVVLSNFVLASGDTIAAGVYLNPGSITYVLEDQTSGSYTYYSASTASLKEAGWSGNDGFPSAEAVDERPDVETGSGSGYPLLSDFNQTDFDAAYVQDEGGTTNLPLGSLNYVSTSMWNGDGSCPLLSGVPPTTNELAAPGPWSDPGTDASFADIRLEWPD